MALLSAALFLAAVPSAGAQAVSNRHQLTGSGACAPQHTVSGPVVIPHANYRARPTGRPADLGPTASIDLIYGETVPRQGERRPSRRDSVQGGAVLYMPPPPHPCAP
ncbi:MAG: hypothetical protein KI785_15630 [Devosiaceae bacterium]|nr:hypothetical protein [Devosiaceae bacterium MH13]